MLQTLDEAFGHIVAFHAFLHVFDVVGDAAMFPDVVLYIQNGVSGTGVIVAGLAYAAGIDDAPVAVVQRGRFSVFRGAG